VRLRGGRPEAWQDGRPLKTLLGASPRLACGMVVEDRAWLLMHGVSMHGLAKLSSPEKARFIAVLDRAMEDLAESEPAFYEEIVDLVHVLVPLENPMSFGSVSSSYVNIRGMICLSHAEQPLLQAETIIHEFCHGKMNQLLHADPLLLPGQSGQVFYSPWRKDARRLRGLLLGAHAFLNVARYLLKSLGRAGLSKKESVDVMLNAASRLFQVQDSLRTLSFYADLTPFGDRFLLGMWRELGLLFHAAQWFPARLMAEARDQALRHRRKNAMFETGFHRAAGFDDRLKRAPFMTKGGRERRPELA
jgi:uncharacterized protein